MVRWVLVAVGLVLLLGSLALIKGCQIATLIGAGKQMQKAGPPPETVSSDVVRESEWQEEISSVGTVSTTHGVTISAETSGTVTRILFESGATTKRGQLLAELEANVEKAQLVSARARLALARDQVGRSRKLAATGAIPRVQLDTDEASLRTAEADVAALEATIARKNVHAPFDGKLGIRLVKVGQYVNAGAPITVLDAPEATHVDFTIPQGDLARVGIDMPVRVALADGEIFAKIAAIDPAVDPMTRAANVRADLPEDPRMRPGMFVSIDVLLPSKPKVVVAPTSAIVHATYGDSIFVIDKKPEGTFARQVFVRLGEVRGDFVRVLDGVAAGQEIVNAGAFKLRNGTRIKIDNTVPVNPSWAPQLENR